MTKNSFSKLTIAALAIGAGLSLSSVAKADWISVGQLCEDIYGVELTQRCLNAIQSHFDLSSACVGVSINGSETTPVLAGEGSCTTAEACVLVKDGTSTAPGEGSNCGGG